MTYRIGLCEDAAEGVTQHNEPLQLQMLSHALDVLDHTTQSVPFGVFKALRATRSALIDQHQLTAARHRLKRGEKVRVIRSGAPVQQQQGDTTTERPVVDAYTTAVDEAFSVAQSPADASIAHSLRSPMGGCISDNCLQRVETLIPGLMERRSQRCQYCFSGPLIRSQVAVRTN